MKCIPSRRRFIIQASAAALGITGTPLPSSSGQSPSNSSSLKTDVPIEQIAETLAATIPALMTENNVPGLGVALIREGAVAWTGSFGVKSVTTGEPVDQETIFDSASLAKPVFTTAVMKLVEAGEIDLDRPLGRYLDQPYIEQVEQHERLKRVTARHVLSHTTGFPNWRRGKLLKFIREPGKRWGYSGEGFAYLKRVIRSVTRQPTFDFVREQVLQPLGMKRTEAKWTHAAKGRAAEAHSAKGESLGAPETSTDTTALSLWTTPGEYARFMTLFMAPLRSEQSMLKPATVEMMLKPQKEIKERAVADKIAWGLGWGLQHSAEGEAFWHWGDNTGFKAFCIGYPDTGLGAAIFSNGELGWKVHRKALPPALGGKQTALMWKGSWRAPRASNL